MKRTLPLLPFFVLLFSFSMFSQTENAAENSYTEYFKLPRETIFLHLNKTTYLSGEEIWFKGYAYDQKNQLTSKATTNFNIGIYDADGKEVKKALFKGENGVTKGNFAIDSTFVSGTYYIKASTNWMKNFNDDGAYIQKIKVFKDKIIADKTTVSNNEYDFQFLPEGGHIVMNTKNNVGFKVTDASGKGVVATGSIFNENNEEVAKFKSNALGLGKFLFQPKSNQKYTSKITLTSGKTIEQALPTIKNQGIAVIMNNLFPDKAIITLHTNAETLKRFSNAEYKLLIHQSGKLKIVNFKFDAGVVKTITIPKKELFKGINTITLFDENEQPILERLFFNNSMLKKASVSVSKLKTDIDSIVLSVKELNLQTDANISISMLPEETESYAPTHTIISSFYLNPYLKGTIENPQYYFEKQDRKRAYELDILLLTQGWSKYNWNAVFRKTPKKLYGFENGIIVNGKVNFPTSGIDKLFLYATKNHPAQFIPLNEDQSFNINNFYLEKDEKIRFSYVDKSGVFKKPSMYVTFSITNKEDNLSEIITSKKIETSHTITSNFDLPEKFFLKESIKLEAVVLKTKKKTKVEDDPISINGKLKTITLKEYHQYPFITDYIQNNGYRVIEDFGEVSITKRNRLSLGETVASQPNDDELFGNTTTTSTTPTNTTSTNTSSKKLEKFKDYTSPLVFLDDVPLRNFSILYNYSMANVEKILIDKSGFGYGLRSAGGVIKIYTRMTALVDENDSEEAVSTTSIAPFAFQKTKEYYAPKYSSYTDNIFKKFGVISWIPELTLTKNETTNFKIFNTRTKRVTVFIEGITKDGALISQKQTIDLNLK
ncbi:hypothetical protein [Kordia sp.]|uniref:hypothetical protein n=1 Tax=Kordia sp. TaxID=1965332 RepID=UPI003D283121